MPNARPSPPAIDRMKLACVVQRYGTDIAGGSEAHCRHLAERLAARGHAVTVLTSCARDYVTWRDAYPAGASSVNGVTVLRFPVARERHLHRFAEISERVFAGAGSDAEEIDWFRENGPDVPLLLEYLQEHGRTFDRVLFWSFRYFPAFFGVPLVADRAILVPTAEDDPAVHLDVLADYFTKPRGYIFLTPEEEQLVAERAGAPLPPSVTIGSGLDPAPPLADAAALESLALTDPFVLYLGRIEHNKGCDTLFRYFLEYADSGRPTTGLVLAGPSLMPIPEHPAIRALGYVSEPVRETLLTRARALVMPSPFESLSMVLLEAWNHATPVLVNGRCKVLKGQARRAEGGLFYETGDEFSEGLQWLLEHPEEAHQLGRQGLAYVDGEYRWPTVMARVEDILAKTAGTS